MLIVQKYGGATLANADKVRSVAQRISERVRQGHQVVAVVSAMGSTTNELIALAHQVSHRPTLREMDMLLTTGERISMSLVSMALHDCGVKAVSLTGSQAGILTDDSHSNAFIQEIKAHRVQEALEHGSVVVLAGFQGVSPKTKEITTLGRGGTDTTAIAMSTFLKADHCEILKDVAAVFTADPRVVKNAKPLRQLSYLEMAEMTFWGAKVLHYRCVELASRSKIPLYVGPAHDLGEGTWIREKGDSMFEKNQILSLNSYDRVIGLRTLQYPLLQVTEELEKKWEMAQIPSPQFLSMEVRGHEVEIWLTGPTEIQKAILEWVKTQSEWAPIDGEWCTVTATCSGTTSPALIQKMHSHLKGFSIHPIKCQWTALSTSFYLPQAERERALQCLHELIEI